jgi:hypothetical protein
MIINGFKGFYMIINGFYMIINGFKGFYMISITIINDYYDY